MDRGSADYSNRELEPLNRSNDLGWKLTNEKTFLCSMTVLFKFLARYFASSAMVIKPVAKRMGTFLTNHSIE